MNSIFKLFILFLTITILQSCSSEKTTKELENNFDAEEISELNKIMDFYKAQIGGQPNEKFEIVFKRHLNEFEVKGSNNKIHSIDFEKQAELYKTLKKTFDEIWYYSGMIKVKNGKEYSTTITQYHPESKYQNFLNEVAQNNDIILY